MSRNQVEVYKAIPRGKTYDLQYLQGFKAKDLDLARDMARQDSEKSEDIFVVHYGMSSVGAWEEQYRGGELIKKDRVELEKR